MAPEEVLSGGFDEDIIGCQFLRGIGGCYCSVFLAHAGPKGEDRMNRMDKIVRMEVGAGVVRILSIL